MLQQNLQHLLRGLDVLDRTRQFCACRQQCLYSTWIVSLIAMPGML
jgi:hypothetical protein